MTPFPGWSARDTLVLALDDAPPAAPIELDGRRFEPKRELHVTLVGRALGAELRRVFGDRLDAATRPAFEALDWRLHRTGRGALIERGGPRPAAAVIEHVELPAMAHWHGWLGTLLGRQLPVPPPHVTLYTQGDAGGIGIGIPTMRALQAMRRHVIDLHALAP